ncbi:unnamed protein product [Brassica napus]|uniref:(rape) hypothetical protein n=1 Tax=Brassica napus TaxID=3708 RepID=A0A816YBY1_BRANA|nr:unnamed protein product [Brassica napus]
MLLRLKSARVDYEKNLKPCNKKLEDEKFDKSVPEVNGGDYNEEGREGLTCSSLMQSLGVDDVICSTSSTKYEGVKKIEVVTVFELNAYVVNSTPHVKSLTVSSSICLITNVPHFLASQVTEFCAPEKDGTESAVFVVFYAEISWLTNVRAAEISELMGGHNYPDDDLHGDDISFLQLPEAEDV